MSRRHAAGVADRYAMLSGGAGPSSLNPSLRSASPFEQPYGNGTSNGADHSDYLGGGGSSAGYKKDDGYGYSGPGKVLGGASWGSYAQQRTAEDLEEGNDTRIEGLSAKVRMLKDITIGIGNEVRDGNADLSTLSDAFSNTSAFLGNTFNRMNHMAKRQGGWWCNMMIFLLFVIWIFVFLWWWRR